MAAVTMVAFAVAPKLTAYSHPATPQFTAATTAVRVVAAPVAAALTTPAPTTTTPTISAVRFTGDTASPTVTVLGSGFGAHPPAGVSDNSTSCGDYTDNGKDYGTSNLWFVDDNNFAAGYGTPPNGTCIGIVVQSWCTHRVVFTFGNAYNSFDHWYLTAGDQYTVTVENDSYSGTVSFGSPFTKV
jgi:hypothetical protein